MSSELDQTIRFRRSPSGDVSGAASAENAESAEFELISTQMLEQILVDENQAQRDRIRQLADDREGWIAQDTASKDFEILKDDELEQVLRSINENDEPMSLPEASFETVSPSSDDTSDDLCLVSTQHLRQVLAGEPVDTWEEDAEMLAADTSGFNPYDNG